MKALRQVTARLSAGSALGKAMRPYSVPWPNHVDTPQDNERVPWDFTEASYKKIQVIMDQYPSINRQSGIMPLLHLAQWQNGGWIPVSAMNKIAQICEVPSVRVYETVTFYAMFNRRPVGDYHVQFCITTPCMIVGSDELIQAALKHLGLTRFGETTSGADGAKTLTLGEMECMGACVNAPMLVVSDYSNAPQFYYDYYEDLTVETLVELLDALRAGKRGQLALGSQAGRQHSAPLGGKTCLTTTPPGPFCRDLDAKKEEAKK
ncbi:NADH dehydrogenase ferredoxin [Diplonema papillatum]|nr:NADH dehydrogenase ferredoxin [Diplonema papillatum]